MPKTKTDAKPKKKKKKKSIIDGLEIITSYKEAPVFKKPTTKQTVKWFQTRLERDATVLEYLNKFTDDTQLGMMIRRLYEANPTEATTPDGAED